MSRFWNGRCRLCLAFVALVLAWPAIWHISFARGAIYWGNGNTIGAARLDGRLRTPSYFRPDFSTYGPIGAVAVSPDYLYWGGLEGIGRLPLYSPGDAEPLVSTGSMVNGLSVDGSHLYWTTSKGDAVGRADLDGGSPAPQFIPGITESCGVAVDGRFIYWGSRSAVGRAQLDGSSVESGFIPADRVCGVAVDSNSLYWGDGGGPAIHRLSLGGGAPEGLLEGPGSVSALAVDASHLYWDAEGSPTASAIGRLSLSGGSPEPNWLSGTTPAPLQGVAVDSLESPPPLPPLSKPAEILATKPNRKNGALFVRVQIPVMGKLRILAPSFAWKVLGNKRRGGELTPGGWWLKLWPGGGTLSKSLRTRLLRRGRGSAMLTLSLKEPGKEPAVTERRVAFVLGRRQG